MASARTTTLREELEHDTKLFSRAHMIVQETVVRNQLENYSIVMITAINKPLFIQVDNWVIASLVCKYNSIFFLNKRSCLKCSRVAKNGTLTQFFSRSPKQGICVSIVRVWRRSPLMDHGRYDVFLSNTLNSTLAISRPSLILLALTKREGYLPANSQGGIIGRTLRGFNLLSQCLFPPRHLNECRRVFCDGLAS